MNVDYIIICIVVEMLRRSLQGIFILSGKTKVEKSIAAFKLLQKDFKQLILITTADRGGNDPDHPEGVKTV